MKPHQHATSAFLIAETLAVKLGNPAVAKPEEWLVRVKAGENIRIFNTKVRRLLHVFLIDKRISEGNFGFICDSSSFLHTDITFTEITVFFF